LLKDIFLKMAKPISVLKKLSVTAVCSGMATLTAYAADSTSSSSTSSGSTDNLKHITSFLGTIPGIIQSVGWPIAIISFAVGAVLMFFGGESAKKAKTHIGWVCLGLSVLFFAADIVSAFKSAAGAS
jgi:hypothetical protein